MTTGITVQAQSQAAANIDLGFWLQSQIINQPMAMREDHLNALVEQISANRFTLPRNRAHAARITEKGTAIVEIHGVLINRAPIIGSFWGLTAYEGLGEQFRRLATDTNVKRIVLDIDSPGGLVSGIRTCADALEELAGVKAVFAIAHDMACSAGYWLACVAEEFSVTPDGDVGSIGVRGGHVSYARLLDRQGIDITTLKAGATKADHNYADVLAPGAAAEMQFSIERQYDRFVEHVARFRPLSEDEVRATDARCWVGQDAVSAGLADRVETLDELITRIEADATRVKPRRKPKVDRASKGGLAPAPRTPSPSRVPATDVPSAGKISKGAKLMSHSAAAEEAPADFAAVLTQAIQNVAATRSAPAAESRERPAAGPTAAEQVAAERERIFSILDSEAAKDRPALAMALARNGLALAAAEAILKAAPAEAAAAAEKPAERDTLASALDREMAKRGNSAGVKPEAGSDPAARPSLASRVASRFPSKKKGI